MANGTKKPAQKDRYSMPDAASQAETDRGKVANAQRKNPRPPGVGTAEKSYNRKYGIKP